MNRILLHYCLIQFKHIVKFLPVRNSIKHLWKVEHNNAQDEGTVKPNHDRTAEKFNKTTSDLPYSSKLFSSLRPDNEYQKWNVYTHKNYHKEIINKCKINKPVNLQTSEIKE